MEREEIESLLARIYAECEEMATAMERKTGCC